jgi:hypothetical protein
LADDGIEIIDIEDVLREGLDREVRSFEGLAVEATREGKSERATYYRDCAAGFMYELQGQ